MGGIFGGVIELVNLLGGCFLYVLIGKKAWKETNSVRAYRIFFGGLICGAVLGPVFYFMLLPTGFVVLADQEQALAFCFLLVPFVTIVCAFALEGIRKHLDD